MQNVSSLVSVPYIEHYRSTSAE